MKKAFQFLAILFIAFSTLTSCSSDNDSTTSAVLLKKLHANVMGADEEYLFSYNGTKLTKIAFQIDMGIVTNGYSKFIYSGNLISQIKDFDNNVNTYNTFFTYNTASQLTEVLKLQVGADYGEKLVFTYNTDNTVDSQNYLGTASSQTSLIATEKFYIENNKLIQKDYSEETIGSQTTYTYDSANHPMKNVTGINAITLYINSLRGARSIALGLKGITNNIVKEVLHYENGPVVDEIKFESSYNNNNYPVSIYTTPDSPGPYNYQYEYNQ